ncbi:MAG: N-acetylmuramoyl-L-alanine amidase [Schwartzia sp.]|nr:N-acetylmuramoyl-L-alanine amidase [Schwartzia sp. (in: firmicutes)]
MQEISRREFLRRTLAVAFGAAFLPLAGMGSAEASRLAEEDMKGVYIHKRFFSFSEYVERPATERIVIHHTEIADMAKGGTAAMIHALHKRKGWAGIGYHYFIRPDGMIEQGRQPPMAGAHAWQNNENTVGVCLAGNFNESRPTEAQMAAAKELAAWLCRAYRLAPGKRGVIVGHRDLNEGTTCPGKYLYPRLNEIRAYCEAHA